MIDVETRLKFCNGFELEFLSLVPEGEFKARDVAWRDGHKNAGMLRRLRRWGAVEVRYSVSEKGGTYWLTPYGAEMQRALRSRS